MKDTNGFDVRQIISESQRSFTIRYVLFENGLLVVVAEGSNKIGSLTVSISSSNKSNTATVIPNRHHSVFVNMITERVASMINGICIVSFYSINQLNLEDMKAIMDDIMKVVKREA